MNQWEINNTKICSGILLHDNLKIKVVNKHWKPQSDPRAKIEFISPHISHFTQANDAKPSFRHAVKTERDRHLQRHFTSLKLKVRSNHPQETLHLSREASVEASPLCCISLPHTVLFCTHFFLRRKRPQKAMRVLKEQCCFATLWLSYTLLALACCKSEHLCPLLLHQGSHWDGEDRTLFPCLLSLSGVLWMEIWSASNDHLKLGVLNQNKSKGAICSSKAEIIFTVCRSEVKTSKSMREVGLFLCLFPETCS